jgi:predicted unusual protein kinase regulating ubiquinone biosynthesis (AarF/ABC1/UbiB family)
LGLIDFGTWQRQANKRGIHKAHFPYKSSHHSLLTSNTGQVKTLTKEQRHLFCKIIIALANEDKDLVVDLMKAAGFQSKNMDPDVVYLYAKVCYDEDNKELTNGKHIQLFMEDLQAIDPIIRLPSKF